MGRRRKANAKSNISLAPTAQVDRGTPETRQRKRKGTMETLITSGKIGPEEIQAAEEIERVFKTICTGLFARAGNYGRSVGGGVQELSDWAVQAHKDRYMPWANGYNESCTVDVCLSIIIDGRTARELDRDYGWRNNTASKTFVRGLRDYAIIAGWVSSGTVAEWSANEEQARPVHCMRGSVA